ncbi:DUF2332 domain-containing protein [Phaeobacter porticola]|uniref:DUF2332 domain-containing protein n=1 Tax=Phaeobacter porticola TaxID=1844006 RepID=A0A1L3I7K5_9RHOB|nr:DUF2332 domain-containing protein [Phaeobacter porticola]APG48073.1 putative protein in bacteria [Phaeobacter porticola]
MHRAVNTQHPEMMALAERYRRFARIEAHGVSPTYAWLAETIASSSLCLDFLVQLPAHKRQPNLFLAALRSIDNLPTSPAELDAQLEDHGIAIASLMMQRMTQTNEPGRCATLLPSFAGIDGPIALLEIGASAGLCLQPDAYGYDWGTATLQPLGNNADAAPVFHCHVTGSTPLPKAQPQVVWRAGLDCNPLDVRCESDMSWLRTLVWPEQTERLANLNAAINVARRKHLHIHKGDLRHDLADLMAEAPRDATLVVFHSAVLTYVSGQRDREAFADQMQASQAVWLSNESARVFPQFSPQTGQSRDHLFLLTQNGVPEAWTGPHGQSLDWVAQ